jgi:hypothetical protein
MNIKIFKKLTLSIPAVLLLFLSGCMKTHDGFVDLSKTSDMVILTGAGLVNFKGANVQIDATSTDTLKKTVTVDLASATNSNGPVTVTLGVDAAKIAAYNAANGTSFQAFPANAFKLISNQVTVPAGQHYGTTTLEIYQNKLDPTVSYMLPISITDGGGKSLSSNQNTIYYNVIGNPIAGTYTEEWIRWNATDTTGAPTYHFSGDLNSFKPESPTQVFVESVDNGAQFHISFTNNNGVLSNFQVTLDPASYDNFGAATITTAPKLLIADPVRGVYRIFFQYNLSSGAARSIIEEFVRQ